LFDTFTANILIFSAFNGMH